MKYNNEKTIRLRGFAEANGIGLSAGIDTGVTTVGGMGKFATVKEDGSLTCEDYSFEDNIPEMTKKIHKRGKVFKIFAIILAITCFVGYFLNGFRGGNENYLGFSMAYIFLGLAFMSKASVVGLGKFLGEQEFENYAKFSAARNAIINFFYDNKRIPTLEELKNTTRIIDREEYVENATFASVWIVMGIFRLLPGVWFALGVTIFLGVMIFLKPGVFRKFWQYNVITAKPEEIHCKAAIKALEEAVKWTDHVSINVSQKRITKEDFIEKHGHIFEEEKCSKCESYKQCKELWDKLSNFDSDAFVYEVTMTYDDVDEEE